jgi:hypothetical protein
VIVDGSKLTVKYYVNKQLKPLNKHVKVYPLYVRIIYKTKKAQFRSLVNYFMHARNAPEFQWTIEGTLGKGGKDEERQQYYTNEKTLKDINERPALYGPYFNIELKIIERTFVHFLSKGTNIIETGNPSKIVHASMMMLSELLSAQYSSLFVAALESEKNTKYKPLLNVMLESKNHFNLLIPTLKSIANQEFDYFLSFFIERALIIEALKTMNPHLYVIDFLIDPKNTIDQIQSNLSLPNSHAKTGRLLDDINNGSYSLFRNIFPPQIHEVNLDSILSSKISV